MNTLGGLFSGVGALDLAIAAEFDAEHAWFAEHEPATKKTSRPRNAAAKVLAHRFPDVPNLGDVALVDWSAVPAVSITAAGYPCQSQSQAGLQLGQDDERWMWPTYRAAIRALRPRWAVGENVCGHVTMDLRQVIADLQEDGYAVAWVTVSASDVGACHERARVFWLAWPEWCGAPVLRGDPFAWLSPGGWGVDDLLGWSPVGKWAYQGAAYQGAAPSSSLLPTPRTTDTNGVGAHGDGGLDLRTAVSLLPTPTASNPNDGEDLESWESRRQRNISKGINGNGQGTPLAIAVRQLLPTPRATDAEKGGPNQRGSSGDLMLPSAVQAERWGRYVAAVTRHEAMTGVPAPPPTGPYGRTGEQRLCPRFTEWMMCWPEGWVTDVPGISRNDAIKACGNGVVIPQARAAVRYLRSLAPADAVAIA